MAGNEYDALIEKSPDAQAKAVTNEYDSMVVDFTKERSQRTRASIYSAQDANPDTTAKAISLSKKTGIPVDTVERDVKAVEGPAALNDYDALIGKSPGLGRWLEDPVNARVAKDDYESLGMLEKRWVDLKGALFQKQATSGALSALKTTEHLQILEDAKGRRARGEIVPPFQQRMLDNEDTMRAAGLKELTGSLGQYLEKGQAAGELPHNKGVAEMQEAAKTDDWASGMWNAFRKDPLGIIATISTQSAVDLPGQIASGVVAGPAGAGAYSFIQEYVNGVLDVLEDKKVDIKNPAALLGAFSNPTLMEEVRQKAATKAAVVGAFDALSFGVASKTVGFGLKGAKARHIANIPAQVITQGALGGAGEALGSVASGQKVDPFAVFAEVAGEAGMAPAEVGGARTWRSLHTEDVKAGEWAKFKALPPGEQTATLHTMGLDKLVADAQGTKLAGRSPEKLAEFLSTVTGPDQNVFVPVEAVQAYFQSKPVEDIQALSDALGITDQIPEALARGGDVVIPLAKYVTEAGKSDIHKAWREDVRMEADGFSIRQAQEDAKVRDERLKAAVDRFEKQLDAGIAEVDATTRVYEDWRDKLKTAGKFTNEAAEQQAAVFAEHYATRAARNPGSYLDAWDAYSKAGLGTGMEVRSQLSDRVGAYPPDDLDVLLDSIRSGKVAPTKTDADANAQFLKDREELAGALGSMGVDTKKMSNAQIRVAIKAEVEKRAKGQTYEQPVYHGTPHIFDKFDLSKIGTGEGAQAYGYGLYFASRKGVAEHYRDALSGADPRDHVSDIIRSFRVHMGLAEVSRDAVALEISKYPDLKAAAASNDAVIDLIHSVVNRYSPSDDTYDILGTRALKELDKILPPPAKGRLYHVDIPEDGAYLHWDKPLSEQSPEVQKAVKKALGDVRPVRLKDGAYSVTMVGADGVGKTLWDISAPTADEAMARYDEWIGTSTGEAIYHQLSRGLDVTPGNSAREASMSLREAGIPGIQYLDGSSRGKGVGAHNYVLFDAGLAEIKSYEQEARGQITFADNLSTITLFQGRDLSTLLHETGHLWLEELGFDAKSLNAPDQIKADYQAVLDWLGSKDGYITRDMHEQFARGFETYLMEGKAPSSALASAFRSFKRWLTQIYKRLTALNSPITPEVRQVFDRLIATDEQIESAQTRQGLNPVFKDAESAGMTKAEFDAYTKRANAVVDDAEQKLLQSTMDTIRKQRTKEWKADEARVREEVTGEVMSESGQQALALLTKGEFPVGTTPEVLKGIKLTKEDIVSLYGDETVLTMLPAGIYRDRSVGPGTMSPDELAPMLGLDSGKDLIERLMQLEAQHKAQAAKGDKRSVARAKIDEETAQRMAERYGDPLNDGTIEQIAMDAVHSDKQAALMATELRVLAKKAGHAGTITWDDIKSWAAEAIADKSVREGTKFDQYARAERTAGRKVEQALIKGDFVAAFKAKQDQMVNHALYMEARKASEEVDSARKLMDRYASAATLKGMDQDYLEQIHGLLEDYEFKNRSATLIAERKSFEAWAAEQAALGKEVEPPPRLAKGLGTTNYRDMTVDELRGLVDTVKQIAHLGRNKKDLFLDGKKRELDATLTEMEETAGKGVQRGASLSVRGLSEIEKSVGSAKHWLRVRNSELLKIERLLEFADGDKSGNGIFSRMIYRPIAKADSAKNDRLVELGKKEKAIYEKVPAEQRKLWTQRHTLPELGVKLDKEGIISIAMNMGNESNLEKMLLGDKWTEDAVRAVVNKHLTKEEWQFVQDMWDHIDSQWPEFAAVNRDVNGVAPPKVEAVPLHTPYGTLKGGYYPVAYDRRENLKAAKVGEMQDSALLMGMASSPRFGRPTTKAGASNVRTNFNAPLDLSLSVIGKHLDEVVHDIFHRRAVADIYKIISNDRFRETLRSRLGPEYEAQFLPWLQRVSNSARTNNTNLKGWDSAMKALRVNVTAMAMGLRVSTMVQQVAGYAVSMQRLGTKDMLKGMAEFWPNPARATREVFAASGEMRNRANNLERDIKANADKYRGKSTWKANLARFSFRGIALADLSVSVPTWLGAYRKGLSENMDEADAVAYADKMVRDTQGAGGTKDMSAFQEGTETWKLMSMFYSFLNVFYNAQQGIVEDARTPGKSFSEWADLFWQVNLLMVVSPIMAALLSGQGPGDDEDWLYWAMRQVGFGAFSGIPLVRDMANTLSRDMGGQPSGGFKMSPVQGPLEGSLRLINDLKKAATGEEVGKNFIKNTFNVVGGFTGLPTGQPGVTAQFLYDALISGSENPENIREWLRGLTYGPPKK